MTDLVHLSFNSGWVGTERSISVVRVCMSYSIKVLPLVDPGLCSSVYAADWRAYCSSQLPNMVKRLLAPSGHTAGRNGVEHHADSNLDLRCRDAR